MSKQNQINLKRALYTSLDSTSTTKKPPFESISESDYEGVINVSPNCTQSYIDQWKYIHRIEKLHASGLHGWGVATGLEVEIVPVAAGKTGLKVLPGIALDSEGRHISLAVNGKAELNPKASAADQVADPKDVTVNGVILPAEGFTNVWKYLTIRWWEFPAKENTYYDVAVHSPWLQLIDVSELEGKNLDGTPKYDGTKIVLAKVQFDGTGKAISLTPELRQQTSLPIGNLQIQKSIIAPQSPNRIAGIANSSAGEIKALDDGGLQITVPKTSDRIVFPSGNIGIGTIEPKSILHVSSPSHLNAIFDRTDTQDHMTAVVGSVGCGLRFSESNFFFIGKQPYKDRNDYNMGIELLRITKDGNVGIGTTDPQSMLQIGEGFLGARRPWMTRGTLVSWDSDMVFLGLKDEGADRKDGVLVWGDNPDDAFRFIYAQYQGDPNGQEIMRLLPNGNIGVGTKEPQSKLEVSAGRLRVTKTDSNNAGVLEISNGSKINCLFTDGPTGNLCIRTDSKNHHLLLQDSYTQGNVGIGTANPTNKFHVVAPGGFPNNVPIVAQSQSSFFGALDPKGNERFAINLDADGTSYPVNFYDKYDGTWRNSISLKMGNVGIGISNPGAKLDVNGDIRFGATLSTPGRMHINGGELLYLLHKNGVIVSKAWGGNGNLTVESDLSVSNQVRAQYAMFSSLALGCSPGGSVNPPFPGETISAFDGHCLRLHAGPGQWIMFHAGNRWDPNMSLSDGGDLNVLGDVVANTSLWRSSRELKENIASLAIEEAAKTLKELNPVKFHYKTDERKEIYLGFIAEDLPELVGGHAGKVINPMDILAVLTKVIQEQQQVIESLTEQVKCLQECSV